MESGIGKERENKRDVGKMREELKERRKGKSGRKRGEGWGKKGKT